LFFAVAVSRSELAQEPAWPNWTSEVNIPSKKGGKVIEYFPQSPCLWKHKTTLSNNLPFSGKYLHRTSLTLYAIIRWPLFFRRWITRKFFSSAQVSKVYQQAASWCPVIQWTQCH
jgi:hypothetical protein